MKNANYSKEHILYLKKKRRKRILINVARIGLLVAVLGIWELLAQLKVIDSFITSSPSRVAITIADLYKNGTLFKHIGITLMETMIGFVIAALLGYAVAVLLYMSDSARKILEPYIVVLNALPKIALGPLIIIWIGTGYTSIIFMTVLVAIIVCIMNTLTGLSLINIYKHTRPL